MKYLFPLHSRILILLFLFSFFLYSTAIAAQSIQDHKIDVWVGELTLDGLTWDVALRDAYSDKRPAEFDIISLWRTRTPLDDYERNGNNISFTIPESLGVFDGRIEGRQIVGTVSHPDGADGHMTLSRATQPKINYQDFTVKNDGVSIASTLATPAGEGPFPVVAILHGGGDSSREAAPYRFWADYLPRHGVAVLIYDKRGNGQSEGNWREVNFDARAKDVIAGLEHVRMLPKIDKDHVGLIAISQGSWVSTVVDREFKGLDFIVHISGPAVPVWEADTYANRVSFATAGLSEEEIQRATNIWLTSLDITRSPKSQHARNAFAAAIDVARPDEWFKKDPYEPDPVFPTFRQWYKHVLDYDPRIALRKSETAMLWIYGDSDRQSDVFANMRELGILRRDHHKPFYVSVYPRAGHGVMIPRTNTDQGLWPMVTAAPGFFDDMMKWIHSEFEMP